MKTLVKLIITSTVALFLLAITITAALAADCSESCYSDGKAFCGPDDDECEYFFADCSIESDADNDGWTDTCDAFPADDSEWVDFDSDGSGHNADCDDFDAELNPEAEEICGNGIDENCDGIDDECIEYSCSDSDNDGYHAISELCLEGNDCSDSDAGMFPGNEETCGDGKDNDCDGVVDEGCSGGSSSGGSKSTPRRTGGSSSGGDWDRCESDWDCSCVEGELQCTDLNECELGLNKPDYECEQPKDPEPSFTEEKEDVETAVEPETEPEEPETEQPEEDHQVVPIVGHAVQDTGRGGNLWPLLGLFLIFVPWKKCSKCGTRHMITRTQCTKCRKVFVKKNGFLYRIRHLPFL